MARDPGNAGGIVGRSPTRLPLSPDFLHPSPIVPWVASTARWRTARISFVRHHSSLGCTNDFSTRWRTL